MVQLVVGSDPELFVFDRETDLPVSAHGLIPGTKEEPHTVDKGMIQVDGMAAEFGIDASSTAEEFIDNTLTVMEQLKEALPDNLYLRAQPMVSFSEEVMMAQPEEALELGCEPDFNGYSAELNPRPVPPGANFRSGGGHVHLGYDSQLPVNNSEHIQACAVMAQLLDTRLGVASLAWDLEGEDRRYIYGAPGAFRPKSYGLEYRTLSNAWLNSIETMQYVFEATRQAFQDLTSEGFTLDNSWRLNHTSNFTSRKLIGRNLTPVGEEYYVQQRQRLCPHPVSGMHAFAERLQAVLG